MGKCSPRGTSTPVWETLPYTLKNELIREAYHHYHNLEKRN